MTSHAYSHLPPHTGDLPADIPVFSSPWKPCRGIWPRVSSRPKETEASLSLKTSGRIPEGGSELGGCSPAAWQCLGRQGVVCPTSTLPDSPDWPWVIPHASIHSLWQSRERRQFPGTPERSQRSHKFPSLVQVPFWLMQNNCHILSHCWGCHRGYKGGLSGH